MRIINFVLQENTNPTWLNYDLHQSAVHRPVRHSSAFDK